MKQFICPKCGWETNSLYYEPLDNTFRIRCSRCHYSWIEKANNNGN